MQKYKSLYFFLFICINICLGAFLIGYYLVVYNSLQTQLQYLLYQYSSSSTKTIYESIITAVIPLGGCLGSVLSSYLFRILGRKNSFVFIDVVCLFGAILTVFESLFCIILGRLICGFSMGVNSSLVALYIKEISPPELSEYFCSIINIALNIGIFTAFLFGLNTLSDEDLALGVTDNWWRFMFGFPIFFCFLRSFLILFKFNYETPIYLLQKNEFEEAMNVIKALYNEENVQEIYEELSKKATVMQQLSLQNKESLKQNFMQKHFANFLIAFSMVLANQFSGINALAYYSSKLFKANGWSNTASNYLNGGFGFTNLISGFFMVIPLKKFGVRTTYLLSLFFVAFFLGLIALCSYLDLSTGTTVNIFCFDFFFNLGCGPIIFIVIPEILPDLLIGVSFLFFWIYAFIIGICFPLMIESSLGVSGSFLLFCICVFVCFIFNFFFFKTKKENEDVEVSSFIERKSETDDT